MEISFQKHHGGHTMKKTIQYIILAALVTILFACQNNEQDIPETETEEQEDINNDDNHNQSEEDIDQEVSVGDEEDESEEEVDEPSQTVDVEYEINPVSWSVDPLTEEVNEEVVLLTIDDAPDGNALKMAEDLAELDAKAIFFVNGHFLQTEEEQEILRQIHELGFAIGNHTYTHPNLNDLSEEEQRDEIVGLNDLVEEIIDERPVFFRAPFGANTDMSHQVAEEEGMVVMNWTYGYDYFGPYMDAEKLAEAMISGKAPEVDVPNSLLRPGANLLMHDRDWTAEALPDIVIGLREKGYEIIDPLAIKTPNQS